jgi:diguanylate cyclase (GGDEF)-like protein
MQYDDLIASIQQLGKDPARLIFEDELTGIPNRRFLFNYFEHKVRWEELDDAPVSLLMMDVDYFKKVNDTYGHEAGDRALVQVAKHLKEVAGEQWVPIRYAGDEFMILMPNGRKNEAMSLAQRLLELIHAEPLQLAGQAKLSLTLSIGVATAPEDAQTSRTLVQKADTALYQAKQAGRDRVVSVSDEPGVVSDKVALQQLGSGMICSREEQLGQVEGVIRLFDQGQSQFVLVEGGSGIGKTTFLEATRRMLQGVEAYLVRTAGSMQENYRPYYLMTGILVTLLSQRDDKGQAAFGSLTEKEISYLGTLLPQLQSAPELRLAPDEAERREGIFSTVIKFIYLLLDYRPLILLIDNLHYADEASLTLFQRLLAQSEVPVFFCGTYTPQAEPQAAELVVPLERFLTDHAADLSLVKIVLNPLMPTDITASLRAVFPRLSAPPDVEAMLARVTQGNPLFLNELLRKLVLDRKLKPAGQEWVLDPLDEGELPQSLDELVKQKINTLDDEKRNLLAQTSAFGEDVPLSVLTGSSQAMESKVLEFLDQAVTLGLLSSDYQLNDETIRFTGKKVLDVAYNNIGEVRRRALHEQVGSYQEGLFKKRLLPSAAPLVYHYTRSANRQKAENFSRVVASESKSLFNAQEASAYKTEEAAITDTPIDALSLAYVPTIVRSLQTAVRNMKTYPADSKNVINPSLEFTKAVQQVLAKNARLNFAKVKQFLLVNGQRATEVGEYKFVADVFHTFLESVLLRGITFTQGVTDDQLKAMLEGFAQAKPEQIDEQYWNRFAAERGLTHIYLKQAGGQARAAARQAASALAATEPSPSEQEGLQEAAATPQTATAVMEDANRPVEAAPTAVQASVAPTPQAAPVEAVAAVAKEVAAQPLATLLASFPSLVNDILVSGGGAQLGTLLTRVIQGIQAQDDVTRGTVLEAVKAAFSQVPLGFQQEFVKQAADPILEAFREEQDPETNGELAGLIHEMATAVVPFAEYRLASRLLMGVKTLLTQIEQNKDPRVDALVKVLGRRLESSTQRLLVDDLKSADPTRQEQAAQLLGSFGMGAMPTLIEVVKREGDLRVRQLAANLLAQLGARAARVYKKELVLEITPEERVRMLEVGDTVTRALKTELAFALGDADPGVREAAYGLAARLNDARITPLLVDYAAHKDPVMAAGAIKCLGKLKPPGLVKLLAGIMKSAKDQALQVACCQALGQVADPAAVEPLTRILTSGGFLRFRKRWPADVRAAAAYALAQISDPRAAKTLASLAKDPDPRLKQLARTATKK